MSDAPLLESLPAAPEPGDAAERLAEQAHRPVLVVDFGAQYAQLIARRVREAKVYSEIVPHTMTVPEMLARNPRAIILSGGPSSVYEPGAPQVGREVFQPPRFDARTIRPAADRHVSTRGPTGTSPP